MSLISIADIREWNVRMVDKSPQEIITWCLKHFGDSATIACGFGAEGMVILDIALSIMPKVRVFTLDTMVLPQATYHLMRECEKRYGITIHRFYPAPEDLSKITMIQQPSADLFSQNVGLRRCCCDIRKVLPLNRALRGFSAWITGLRQDSSVPTRYEVPVIEADKAHGGIVKVNPVARCSAKEIWDYINAHRIPYNRLYDEGYGSIGCDPCTRARQEGDAARAGRWWWEDGPKECGLHSIDRED